MNFKDNEEFADYCEAKGWIEEVRDILSLSDPFNFKRILNPFKKKATGELNLSKYGLSLINQKKLVEFLKEASIDNEILFPNLQAEFINEEENHYENTTTTK